MGVFDLFRRRRERESAMPPPVSSPGSAEPGEVVGQPIAAPSPAIDFGTLGSLGALGGFAGLGEAIKAAAEQGNLQVTHTSQTFDVSGASELGDEIREIMKAHGFDAEAGASQSIDASSIPGMQQEILAALARHGLDFSGGAPSDPPSGK